MAFSMPVIFIDEVLKFCGRVYQAKELAKAHEGGLTDFWCPCAALGAWGNWCCGVLRRWAGDQAWGGAAW